jgi:hypothetical protein
VPDAGDDAAAVAVFPEHAARTLPLGTKVRAPRSAGCRAAAVPLGAAPRWERCWRSRARADRRIARAAPV